MFPFSNFPPFGRGKWGHMQNFGVLEKICNYISSKKQKLKRFHRLEAPNGVRKCRERGKRRQNLRKVCEKWGSRNIETTGPIVIHLTRAFRRPCHGSVAPRTPIKGAHFPGNVTKIDSGGFRSEFKLCDKGWRKVEIVKWFLIF